MPVELCSCCGHAAVLCLAETHSGLCAECVESIAGMNSDNAEIFGLSYNAVSLRMWAMQYE